MSDGSNIREEVAAIIYVSSCINESDSAVCTTSFCSI